MKQFWVKYKRELVVLLATIAMGAIFTAMNPNFLKWNNFLTILQQMVLNGILAVGIMVTIITGGIDLCYCGDCSGNDNSKWRKSDYSY